ncbi:MAG: hypothetical protein H8E90_04175 [Anaerolineales bacterium]|nr:hypothetical protein [Anaerolineales bacterium]
MDRSGWQPTIRVTFAALQNDFRGTEIAGVRKMSSNVTLELSMNQVLSWVRRLPTEQKLELWRALSRDLDRTIDQRFRQALAEIRVANQQYSEEEVMADVAQTVAEVRAARRAARGG